MSSSEEKTNRQEQNEKIPAISHTPGPWRVDETKALGAYGVWTDYATHPAHDGDRCSSGYPSQVCSVVSPTFSEFSREVRDANARLITASPELLKACKATVEMFDAMMSMFGELEGREGSVHHMLVTAIAKAENGAA